MVSSSSRDVLARLDPRLSGRVPATSTEVVPAHPAATVVLVRDHPLQVYLMHRHSRMPFAAGMVVFPGGRVDPVDHDQQGAEDDHVLRCCAVRELAEETGVRLQVSDLLPWAHWITPEHEPRRYDTYFYLAANPDDQEPANISGEADQAEWCRPADALWAADRGELALMPPTRSVLIELAEHDSVASLINSAADRRVETVLPRLVETADGWVFDYGLDKEFG